MKGRIAKPTALKLLEGNPGNRKLDGRCEPQPVIGLGAPPAYLDDEAKRYWMAEGPKLVKLGTLGESDAPLFALLCQSHSRNLFLSARIEGLRQMKRPSARDERTLERLENQRLKNATQFQRLSAEFGLGAAARTRIRVNPTDGQEEFGFATDKPLTGLRRALDLAPS